MIIEAVLLDRLHAHIVDEFPASELNFRFPAILAFIVKNQLLLQFADFLVKNRYL